jgi:fermentation-respiration switch protein FrsA (DUF1100 family)
MQKVIEIESRGLILRGMLHTPEDTDGKLPVVCIYHGFTGNKMEPHFIFVKLSRLLEKKGIASVRFDFGGSGESDGDFIDMTISKELEDAKAVLNYAKALDFAATDRIGVVGLSLGGAVSGMLAGDCRDNIKTLCLWAPAGSINTILERISDDKMQKAHKMGFIDVGEIIPGWGGLALGIRFIEELSRLDVYKKAALYNKKVLLIHGGKDEIVSLNVSEKYLKIYGKNGILHVIQGADHTFNKLEWEKEVLDHTVEFLECELKK